MYKKTSFKISNKKDDDNKCENIDNKNDNVTQNTKSINLDEKNTNTYMCDICDYNTSRKYNYDLHLSSVKHIKKLGIKLAKNSSKISNTELVSNFYICENCNYKTSKKYNYDLHILTEKHKKLNKEYYLYNCDICNYHTNNKCNFQKHELSKKHNHDKINNIMNTGDGVMFSSIMSEIKNMMAEQNQTIMNAITNLPSVTNNANITNNNTNNHQFNMNMFLNETCKDAMNMSEFIENLTVTMEDMEMTGTLGFAKGMSRIIMNNLNALEVHKRPIHCSDAKRETLYVKNNGVWEKDTDDKKHTKELIYKVSSLNLKHLLKWRELPRNKGYDNPEHKKNDEFTILVMEINKVKIEEIEKVVSIISKNVTIDKNKVRMSGYLN